MLELGLSGSSLLVLAFGGIFVGLAGFALLAITSWQSPTARRRGSRTHWARGWLVNGVGMTLIGASWLVLACLGPRASSPALFWLGLPLGVAAGALFFLGASRVGRLKTPSRYSLDLDTSGLYSWVRHPQALALSILVVAIALMTRSVPLLLSAPVWVACWVGYTYFEEELELVPTFGHEYLAYRERTPRLWPRFQRARDAVSRLLAENEEARDVP